MTIKSDSGLHSQFLQFFKRQEMPDQKPLLCSSTRVRKTSSAWKHCCPKSFSKNLESFCNKVTALMIKNFLTIQKLSGQSKNYPDNPKTVRTIQKLSRQSKDCPDNTKSVRTIQKVSRQFKNCPDIPKIVRTI